MTKMLDLGMLAAYIQSMNKLDARTRKLILRCLVEDAEPAPKKRGPYKKRQENSN